MHINLKIINFLLNNIYINLKFDKARVVLGLYREKTFEQMAPLSTCTCNLVKLFDHNLGMDYIKNNAQWTTLNQLYYGTKYVGVRSIHDPKQPNCTGCI